MLFVNVNTQYTLVVLKSDVNAVLVILAELQEIDDFRSWPCKSGQVPKTLRFDPVTSQTSGLFVAKFTKSPTF